MKRKLEQYDRFIDGMGRIFEVDFVYNDRVYGRMVIFSEVNKSDRKYLHQTESVMAGLLEKDHIRIINK